MVAPYPRPSGAADAVAEREMGLLVQAITAIRNIRGEMRLSPAQVLGATIKATADDEPVLRAGSALMRTLARARLIIDPQAARPRASALGIVGQSEIYVELEGLVDLGAELQRL